jgi:hypothetical protein
VSFFADPATSASLRAFGETAVWRRAGHDDVSLTGIYDSRHMDMEAPGGEASVNRLVTQLAVRHSAADGIARLDTIFVRDTEYRVQDVRRDGQDMAVLLLEKVGDGT